ncbi:MAG: sensor histidine kinase, partial [Ferrimicrobium acidiphilum]
VDQLATLSDDLLLLAQGQAGSLTLTLQEVDLERLAAGALAAANDRCGDASLSFVLDCPVALSVVADPIRVRQILDNLLENCLRYASRGMVTLSVGREGDWVVIAIQDEGEGFPDELIDSAFERFRRGVPSRSRETGGAGLGLSIVRLLTELHHGSVKVANVAGGARVCVWLPLSGEISASY